MGIYTRKGDAGETSLSDGSRVSKASLRVEAYGTLDETNAAIGFARAAIEAPRLDAVLGFIQQRLFNCCCLLATPAAPCDTDAPAVTAGDVAALERAIDFFEERTGPLTTFVIEGGAEASARLHLARAIARRAERRLVDLADSEGADEQVLAFVNRLSDLLFSAARYANLLDRRADEPWDPNTAPPGF